MTTEKLQMLQALKEKIEKLESSLKRQDLVKPSIDEYDGMFAVTVYPMGAFAPIYIHGTLKEELMQLIDKSLSIQQQELLKMQYEFDNY